MKDLCAVRCVAEGEILQSFYCKEVQNLPWEVELMMFWLSGASLFHSHWEWNFIDITVELHCSPELTNRIFIRDRCDPYNKALFTCHNWALSILNEWQASFIRGATHTAFCLLYVQYSLKLGSYINKYFSSRWTEYLTVCLTATNPVSKIILNVNYRYHKIT